MEFDNLIEFNAFINHIVSEFKIKIYHTEEDFNEEYLKDGIKIDSGEKIKSQISEKERQEYDLYDPNMQMYRAQQDFLASQKKEQKNNVQVNNQNNNTNIINQPLTTANPLNHNRSRTNIGQE